MHTYTHTHAHTHTHACTHTHTHTPPHTHTTDAVRTAQLPLKLTGNESHVVTTHMTAMMQSQFGDRVACVCVQQESNRVDQTISTERQQEGKVATGGAENYKRQVQLDD